MRTGIKIGHVESTHLHRFLPEIVAYSQILNADSFDPVQQLLPTMLHPVARLATHPHRPTPTVARCRCCMLGRSHKRLQLSEATIRQVRFNSLKNGECRRRRQRRQRERAERRRRNGDVRDAEYGEERLSCRLLESILEDILLTFAGAYSEG